MANLLRTWPHADFSNCIWAVMCLWSWRSEVFQKRTHKQWHHKWSIFCALFPETMTWLRHLARNRAQTTPPTAATRSCRAWFCFYSNIACSSSTSVSNKWRRAQSIFHTFLNPTTFHGHNWNNSALGGNKEIDRLSFRVDEGSAARYGLECIQICFSEKKTFRTETFIVCHLYKPNHS